MVLSSPVTKTLCTDFPPPALEQSLRALWDAASRAAVLILPQIKLNSQLSSCASFLVDTNTTSDSIIHCKDSSNSLKAVVHMAVFHHSKTMQIKKAQGRDAWGRVQESSTQRASSCLFQCIMDSINFPINNVWQYTHSITNRQVHPNVGIQSLYSGPHSSTPPPAPLRVIWHHMTQSPRHRPHG